ncbi:MAG TPA: sigma factor-like helix-turn-helix DNA-binding protein [Chthoniobacterales bacterium]
MKATKSWARWEQVALKEIESQFESRHWLVFSKRLLASKEEKETLESIASVYVVTREHVRQIEEECLDAMCAPLIRDDYRGLTFRFRPELTAMFQAALVHFQAMGLSAWTKTRWLRELAQLWQVSSELLDERYRPLAEILSYRAVRLGDPALDALVVSESTSRKVLVTSRPKLRRFTLR